MLKNNEIIPVFKNRSGQDGYDANGMFNFIGSLNLFVSAKQIIIIGDRDPQVLLTLTIPAKTLKVNDKMSIVIDSMPNNLTTDLEVQLNGESAYKQTIAGSGVTSAFLYVKDKELMFSRQTNLVAGTPDSSMIYDDTTSEIPVNINEDITFQLITINGLGTDSFINSIQIAVDRTYNS